MMTKENSKVRSKEMCHGCEGWGEGETDQMCILHTRYYLKLLACDYPTLSLCKVHEHVPAQIYMDENFISILPSTFAHSKDATRPN